MLTRRLLNTRLLAPSTRSRHAIPRGLTLVWHALALSALFSCAPAESAPKVSTHARDWRDEVIYQIVVDRFENGDTRNDTADGESLVPGDLARFQGGDWTGIRQRLDYIEGLGATAIWISPVVANMGRVGPEDGYHGYWASDFISANPRFGTLQELRGLVRDAHDRDMLVVFDVVTNHAGRVFSYDLNGDGLLDDDETEPPFAQDGPYDVPVLWHSFPPRLLRATGPEGGEREVVELDPSHFHRRGRTEHQIDDAWLFGDFPTGLRDLATTREDVLDMLVETYAYWVEQTDVDGFRLDAVPHMEVEFWHEWSTRLRARLKTMGKEKFLLLGEVFRRTPEDLVYYTQVGSLDSVFDFNLKFEVIDEVVLGGQPPVQARGALETYRSLYRTTPQPNGVGLDPWQARVAFADNHDTRRIRSLVDDAFGPRLAMTVVFTVDAIPTVYYGTEQDLDGTVHHLSREPLWPTGFRTDGSTYRFIAHLSRLRRELIALRRGELKVVYASEFGGYDTAPDAALLAYERYTSDARALIVINGHARQSSKATIPTGFVAGTVLTDRLEGRAGPFVIAADGSLEIMLPERSAVLLVPSD